LDNLSRPCPEGQWRWAGRDPVPGAAEKAAAFRADLVVAERALAGRQDPELVIPPADETAPLCVGDRVVSLISGRAGKITDIRDGDDARVEFDVAGPGAFPFVWVLTKHLEREHPAGEPAVVPWTPPDAVASVRELLPKTSIHGPAVCDVPPGAVADCPECRDCGTCQCSVPLVETGTPGVFRCSSQARCAERVAAKAGS
jgi:hypothetical protein